MCLDFKLSIILSPLTSSIHYNTIKMMRVVE
jgi:hypothetical protein